MTDDPFTHLVCIGACYIDTILAVPQFPKEDAKQRASNLLRRRGGNCPNTLEVLRQLLPVNFHTPPHAHHDGSIDSPVPRAHPLQLFLLTILPARDSADVRFISESLNQTYSPSPSSCSLSHEPTSKPVLPTVDISQSFHRPSQSQAASSYVIKSLETNSRTIVNYNALDDMTLAEFQIAVTDIIATDSIADSTKRRIWFHFEGRVPDVTGQCLTWLRHRFPGPSPSNIPAAVEITISIELEHPSRPGLELLAAHADVVFYSRSWAEGWGGYGGIAACLRGEVDRIRSMHASDENAQRTDENTAGDDEKRKTNTHDLLTRKMTLCCTWGEHGAGAVEIETHPGFETRPVSDRTTTDSGVADPKSSRAVNIVERPAWHPPTLTSTQGDIVDTVGAGDTWTAGMLFTFLSRDRAVSKWDLTRRVDFANEVAGRKILREGFADLGRDMMGRLELHEDFDAPATVI